MFYGANKNIFIRASELRINMTEAEKVLWEVLRNKKVFKARFKRQHPIEQGAESGERRAGHKHERIGLGNWDTKSATNIIAPFRGLGARKSKKLTKGSKVRDA